MQKQQFDELESRASRAGELDHVRQLEARTRVLQEIQSMKAEGSAFELSDEEVRMLTAFRRFKLRMRKSVENFNWQTRKPEGVEIVKDAGLVISPDEASTPRT